MAPIELGGWISDTCLMGVGNRCVVRSDFNSLIKGLNVKIGTSDPSCLTYYLGMCFQKAAKVPPSPIFNFSVFVTALTLLAVVFTISDTRFKFRVNVAPMPLRNFSVLYLLACGVAILWSDLAFNQGWQIPRALNSDVYWQVVVGAAFLFLVLVWFWVGFLRPPKFGRLNAFKYARELYRVILTGTNAEITAIAMELNRSAQSIIKHGGRGIQAGPIVPPAKWPWRRLMLRTQMRIIEALGPELAEKIRTRLPGAAPSHANAILLLMGERRFCAAVASGAPVTAIGFFQELAKQRRFGVPIRHFSVNVSQEAIANNQSLLHYEGDEWTSAALGHWKPFSAAVYGNWDLVEQLSRQHGSPLDVGYSARTEWKAEQFEAFTQAILITFQNYLDTHSWRYHSDALIRAIKLVSEIAGEHNFSLSDEADADLVNSEAVRKLQIGVRFAEKIIRAIEKLPETPIPVRLRHIKGDYRLRDMYDEIADLVYSLIDGASRVRSENASWSIQHNAVWSRFFGRFEDGKVSRIIQFKVRRLVYDEISGRLFSFVTTRIFGLAINVLGFNQWVGERKSDAALRKVLIRWARRNLVRISERSTHVVDAGLPANLKFDRSLRRLIRTYPKLLDEKPKVIYLQLD